jgi:hypothetical protein
VLRAALEARRKIIVFTFIHLATELVIFPLVLCSVTLLGYIKNLNLSRAWWYILVIPGFGRLKQEGQ